MNAPVCKHLRTKKQFIPAQEGEAFAEPTEPVAQEFYWCNRTLSEIGVDDQPAHAKLCARGRCCFEQ